jgi:threonyl-tRNA synthetase
MEENKLHAQRHSAEHVLTQAMDRLWPGKILRAMGPAIENGFYYDFETLDGLKIAEADFPAIEKEMKKIEKKLSTYQINIRGDYIYTSTIKSNKTINLLLINLFNNFNF